MLNTTKKKQKDFHDKYIVDVEDFFSLPEQTQDIMCNNLYFDYISIWEKLNMEHKMLITRRPDFMVKELYHKLGVVEKYNVIQCSVDFDYKKYIPEPNHEELNLLLNRHDFGSDEYFKKLNNDQKLRVCSKRNFDYEKYWEELTTSMKLEVVKSNLKFDPYKYFSELNETITEEYSLTDKEKNKTMLDFYCERQHTDYDKIWDKLEIQQKLNVIVKSHNFVVGDRIDEVFDLLKNYPFKLYDFISSRIFNTSEYFFNKEIILEELDIKYKELVINLFKSFKLFTYEDIMELREELKTGKYTGVVMHPLLYKNVPFSIVKNKKDQIKFLGLPGIQDEFFEKGFYLYDIQKNTYSKIKDYNYILRENKLNRLLNNETK